MSERELFTVDRLFCPGPTPVPDFVKEAGAESSIYHRSDEFYKIFRRSADLLAPLFGSKTLPIILAASGTGAMDAAFTNLTDVGDEIVTVKAGKFGERWEKLAEAYRCPAEVVTIEWGTAPTAAQILAAVKKQKNTKAIFIQANETSTGAYFGIEKLVPELRKSFSGFIAVDCISSLGAHPMKMDDWQIDAVTAGSQKGFGLPPGLAFIALSERAWANLSKRPKFYFDLAKERKGQAEGRSAWTPASSLVHALKAALEKMNEVGYDRVAAHHTHLADAARAATKAMGLNLFAGSAPSNALTAITVPKGIDGQKLVKRLRQRFGMFFAGGQDELKGKIVRFAHLGFVNRFDLIDGVAALEFALAEEGYDLDLGRGVQAAMKVLAKAP